MRAPRRWHIAGVVGIGCLGVPLFQLPGARPDPPRPPRIDPARLPPHHTASQGALREAAFWWVEAVQLANDECDEAREALRPWDPAATFNAAAAVRQLLACDRAGYLRRARRESLHALALARTPRDRHRAEGELALLARTAGQPAPPARGTPPAVP